ncbi:MAG TPA: VapC toxin family PIN domain ribonuclease [Planctomycetes bacterium]|nr:VapC toxin family PIN domain ribonuclease [Planctomycetota bacterium]
MRVALDTNRYIDFSRGIAKVVEQMREFERVFLPVFVLAELRAGFLCGTKAIRNERRLIEFLSSPRVEVLYADETTTHHYARLFAQLRRQGAPIPTNDLWIAALVLQHDLLLYARDRHFDVIPQLARV